MQAFVVLHLLRAPALGTDDAGCLLPRCRSRCKVFVVRVQAAEGMTKGAGLLEAHLGAVVFAVVAAAAARTPAPISLSSREGDVSLNIVCRALMICFRSSLTWRRSG